MSIKDLFKNDNKINESNIILFATTIMLVVIDIVALCFKNFNSAFNTFFLVLVLEHMLFIYFINKTENSTLDSGEVLKSVENIAIESIKK